MINIIYRLIAYIGSIIGGIYKIHQIMLSGTAPEIEIVKIIGIIFIVWFILTPSDYLQSYEDR